RPDDAIQMLQEEDLLRLRELTPATSTYYPFNDNFHATLPLLEQTDSTYKPEEIVLNKKNTFEEQVTDNASSQKEASMSDAEENKSLDEHHENSINDNKTYKRIL